MLFGWTPREANRKVDAWDASSLPEAREARERKEEARREYEARLAEEMAEAEAVYARDFGLER
jgi:hypothetical protein